MHTRFKESPLFVEPSAGSRSGREAYERLGKCCVNSGSYLIGEKVSEADMLTIQGPSCRVDALTPSMHRVLQRVIRFFLSSCITASKQASGEAIKEMTRRKAMARASS